MDEENIIVKKYGLKNKREIWKAKSEVSKLRRRAKALIGHDAIEQKEFFDKLGRMGIPTVSTSDVLALTEESLLDRRLQTVVFKKKLANTPGQARQFIVHKTVLVDGKVVNSPSFIVTRDLEDKISLKERKIKEKPAEEVVPKEEEKTEEVKEKTEETAPEGVPSEESKE